MTVFSKIVERKPPTVVMMPPDAFADTWPEKPSEPVPIGLRLLCESELQTARAEAARKAVDLHDDDEGRYEAYNDGLIAWAVAAAACDPEDVNKPFVEMPYENIPLAFTSQGLRRLWDELEVLHASRSPLTPEADDDELKMLAGLLTAESVGAIDPKQQARVRRLATFLLENIHA